MFDFAYQIRYAIYMICPKCKLSKESDTFWDTHQTMSDGHVWCANRKDKQ